MFAGLNFGTGAGIAYPVAFYSFEDQQRTLMTVNRLAWLLPKASTAESDVADAYATTLQEHFECHLARLEGRNIQDVSDATAWEKATIPALPQDALVKGGDGFLYFTLNQAAQVALNRLSAFWKLQKPYTSSITNTDLQDAYYARTFRDVERFRGRAPARIASRLALAVISLALSVILLGAIYDWAIALVVIPVLLAHEAGHAIAMAIFGYRNINILFIPLLGAVASANPRRDVSAWQKAIVLLAGPLPGLALGTLLLTSTSLNLTPFGEKLAIVAITLNAFNLLPISPLDGGRLFEIALFSHWPMARLIFRGFSVAALAAIGLWLTAPALIIFAAFLGLGLSYQHLILKTQRAWKKELDEDAQVVNLFSEARQLLKRQNFASQYQLVRTVIEAKATPQPRVFEIFTILVASLLLCAGAGLVVYEHFPKRITASLPKDPRTKAQRAFDDAYGRYDDGDKAVTPVVLQGLADQLAPSDPRRIDVTFLFALASSAPQKLEDLKRLMSDNKRGYWLDQNSLAYASLHSGWTASAKLPPNEQAAVMRALVDEVVRLAPSTYVATTYTRSRIARLLDVAGDSASADAFLQETQRTLERMDRQLQQRGGALDRVIHERVWFCNIGPFE